MNSSIRKVALGLSLVFAGLFAQLNYVQLARSRDLTDDSRNRRNAIAEEGTRRGDIIAGDGSLLAESVPSGDPRFKWERRYPQGSLFGQITGWYTSPFFCDSIGLERTWSAYIAGKEPQTTESFVDQLLGRKPEGNALRLTLDPALQRVIRSKLGKRHGGAAIINSSTGAVLGLYGTPTFDPNPVSVAKQEDCAKAKAALERDPNRVLLSRAFQVRYPPGSTFKIITAAAGLENKMTVATTFPDPNSLDLPDTDKNLTNFGKRACVGGRISLGHAFTISCDTTFAQIALKLGVKKLVAMAEKFGFDRAPDFDLEAIPSCMKAPFTGLQCEDPDINRPFLAYSGIGQGDVRTTPLQMALVGAAIQNGGYLLRPYVVDRVVDATGKIVKRTKPERSERIYSAKTARDMRKLMSSVTCAGTGAGIGFKRKCSGLIGGKTGTAQTGIKNDPPDVWFVAWGPGIAVAVAVENGGGAGAEATGAQVAGPIAKALLEAALDQGATR